MKSSVAFIVLILFIALNSFSVNKEEIIIEEFSDFQCPYCARVQPVLKELKNKYGDRLEIKFKHFPLPFHKFAQKAAEASECARDQGKFWEYHDLLFENQRELSEEVLIHLAERVGLKVRKFKKCLNSGKKAELINKDIEEGKSKGVTGTPCFFINGIKLKGARPIEDFINIIEGNK